MAYPVIFTQLAAGVQPLSDFDTMFNVVGSMGTIFCTATGTNTIALALNTNMPALAYSNYQAYGFVAANTSTGSITLNVAGLGALPAYAADGVTQLGSGNIVAGTYYVFAYNSALNSAAGGLQLISATPSAVLSNLYVSGTSELVGDLLVDTSSVLNPGAGTTNGFSWNGGRLNMSAANQSVLQLQVTSASGSVATEVFFYGTTQVGSISVTSSATAYNTSSDQRIKTNITPVLTTNTAGNIIDQLQPSSYVFTEAYDPSQSTGVGFVAQQLVNVIPQAVTPGDASAAYGDEGFQLWQVDMSKIVPYLVAELQSVRKRLALLEAKP